MPVYTDSNADGSIMLNAFWRLPSGLIYLLITQIFAIQNKSKDRM